MTVRWVVALVLLLVTTASAADTLQTNTVFLASNDLYVREKTNHNDHPRIDEVLVYMGLPRHLPYCASFVVWWYNHAGYGRVLPKVGGVLELQRRLLADELKYRRIDPEEVALGIVKLQPGDIVIWNHGGGKGHAGVTERQVASRTVETIEANTQPGDTGNQREGGGVYRRTRKINPNSRTPIGSFLRVR